MATRYDFIKDIASLTLELEILQGKGLIAKDRSMLGTRTTSDPYVKVYLGGKSYGHKTKVVEKDLNPKWNDKFKILLMAEQVTDTMLSSQPLRLVIYDEDDVTADDLMGVVDVPISLSAANRDTGKYEGTATWYKVGKGEKEAPKDDVDADGNPALPHFYCHNAKGEVQVKLSFSYKTRKMVFG